MDPFYYETIDRLETMGVSRDYILGWVGGYLQTPKREEQRVTEAYQAGYDDGMGKETTHADAWKG